MQGRGSFITLEGADGCGKSTQAALLADALASAGREVVRLREPGGTAISEKIRGLLLDPANAEMVPECELLLYEASRAQLTREVIEPALARGAKIIEKHFTVDRDLEGNDHKVSLLPEEFAQIVQQIREVEDSIGAAGERVVSTGEAMNRINLAKSLVAARPLRAGATITADDVTVKSPGRGLQPNELPRLVGRTLHREMAEGDFFFAGDLTDTVPTGRQFQFRRPWGLPVRYHDFAALTKDCTPDFLEFHQSYRDMDLDPADFFAPGERLGQFFTIHAPDLYAGDFLIDLASPDDAIWERSIREVQRVTWRTVVPVS